MSCHRLRRQQGREDLVDRRGRVLQQDQASQAVREDRLRLLTRTEATGTYTRLRSMSTVAGAAAVTGGTNLVLAQQQRAAAVAET